MITYKDIEKFYRTHSTQETLDYVWECVTNKQITKEEFTLVLVKLFRQR